MRALARLLATAALTAAAATATAAAPDADPYLWLSHLRSPAALQWVRQQNAHSAAVLESDPLYGVDRTRILSVLNAHDRIPEPTVLGRWVLNFWQDAAHPRGVWRRTSLLDYASVAPHWQTLLDLDELDRTTHADWVWMGADCTPTLSHCLINLSPGGGDVVTVREYDPAARRFVAGGFSLPLAKSTATYLDDDSILFATDFGPGTMTPSSYPRIVKLWRRGQTLAQARTLYSGQPDDMQVLPQVFRGPYGHVALILRQPSFFRTDYFVLRADGSTLQLPLPQDAQLQGVTAGQLLATLQDDWRRPEGTIKQGALIAYPVLSFERSTRAQPVAVLYTPGLHDMIDEVAAGRDAVYASIYRDVTGSIIAFRLQGGSWRQSALALPAGGSTSIVSTNDWGPEAYFIFQSFLTPPTLYAYRDGAAPRPIKAQPARFNAAGLTVRQYWVSSRDGTPVPYFLVGPERGGARPTILYGYGGFQVALTPWYWNDGTRPLDAGQTWLTRGGAIAVANIRGGGEFGPAWHQAALTDHRQRAFDDFEAIASDIERRGLATPKQLGILGASNGGLLVTTVMVQRPRLFGAVVCQRPLIDMLRYTQFGAGASWVGEYGSPADPRMAAYLRGYSPYENVRADVTYPPVLFITETSDDRVTPVFARMMAAKMEAQHHRVLFHEALEGGHGPGATHAEEADYWALSYVFLARQLGLERERAIASRAPAALTPP